MIDSRSQPPEPTVRYDLFVSYHPADAAFVFAWLLPRLKEAGLSVAIDAETFQPGAPVLEETERSIVESRHTLAVLTPSWATDNWDGFEGLLVQSQDPGARFRKLIPLLLELPEDLPRRIQLLQWVDMRAEDQREAQLQRVIASVQGQATLPELRPDRAMPSGWQRLWELRLIGGIALGIVLLLGLVGWWVFFAQRGPMVMDRVFNIAVADLTSTDPSELDRLLSSWVFNALVAENEAYAQKSDVLIWHDSLPRSEKGRKLDAMPGDSAEERARAAAVLAEEINAHVLIYGAIRESAGARTVTLEFYVPKQLGSESNLTLGRYQMGDPIPLAANFDPGDALAARLLEERISERAKGLYWLLLGIREDLLGESEAALALFEQARERLTDWEEVGEGKENLYFFIGREQLFLERFDEAASSLQQALDANPSFARAQIALAGVHLRRAQMLAPAERLNDNQLQLSLAGYEQGIELADRTGDQTLKEIAQMALANALHLRAEAELDAGLPEQAIATHDQALGLVTDALDVLAGSENYRLVAQGNTYLGISRLQKAQILERQGRKADSRALYELAREAFQTCAAQPDLVEAAGLKDDVLTEQVAPNCQQLQETTESILSGWEE